MQYNGALFEAILHLERACRQVARCARALRTTDDRTIQELTQSDIRHGLRQIALAGDVLRDRAAALTETGSASPSL